LEVSMAGDLPDAGELHARRRAGLPATGASARQDALVGDTARRDGAIGAVTVKARGLGLRRAQDAGVAPDELELGVAAEGRAVADVRWHGALLEVAVIREGVAARRRSASLAAFDNRGGPALARAGPALSRQGLIRSGAGTCAIRTR
jgi:hypothetical protein